MRGVFEEFSRVKDHREILRSPKIFDYSSHVFEFGDVLDDVMENDPEGFRRAMEAGNRLYDAGLFRLPFPSVVYTWREQIDGQWGKRLLFLRDEPELTLHFVAWDGTWVYPGYARVRRGFQGTERVEMKMMGTSVSMRFTFDSERLTFAAGNAIAFTVLLMASGSRVEELPVRKETNQLRRARGLLPLPSVMHRVISLSRPIYPAADEHLPGSSKRPHDRRSHLRHYQSGKTVVVKSSKIHGGSDRPAHYIITP